MPVRVTFVPGLDNKNMLALNNSRTEVLHFDFKFVTYPIPQKEITVGESQISSSREIGVLCAISDTNMTME